MPFLSVFAWIAVCLTAFPLTGSAQEEPRFVLEPASAGVPFGTTAWTKPKQIRLLRSLHRKAEKQILVNEITAAKRTYLNILLIEPDDEVAYVNLARCHMLLGETEKAEEALLNALDINPQNETAIFLAM